MQRIPFVSDRPRYVFQHAHPSAHGTSSHGKPVALQFMGRAGPVGASDLAYAFDDELLRGLDVPFLRDVVTLVDAMVAADPSLARVAPGMVARDLAA